MPSKTKEGRSIISAGDVAMFSLCPESWRLRVLLGLERNVRAPESKKGIELHNQWAERYDEVLAITRSVKLLLLMLGLASILYGLLKAKGWL